MANSVWQAVVSRSGLVLGRLDCCPDPDCSLSMGLAPSLTTTNARSTIQCEDMTNLTWRLGSLVYTYMDDFVVQEAELFFSRVYVVQYAQFNFVLWVGFFLWNVPLVELKFEIKQRMSVFFRYNFFSAVFMQFKYAQFNFALWVASGILLSVLVE